MFYSFWDEFKYLELNENMRQRLDPIFFDLLCRIRLGIPNQEDINQLELRLINKVIKDITLTETAKFYKSLDKNVFQSVFLFCIN